MKLNFNINKIKLYLKDKKIRNTMIAIVSLLFLIIGATYAYFTIQQSSADIRNNKVDGAVGEMATPTLTTNTSELNIKLTAEDMHKDKMNTVYYATEDGKPGVAEGFGLTNQTLATASVTGTELVFDCAYSYNISATVSKEITDGSEEDVAILIKESTGEMVLYSLGQLLDGVEHTGTIKGISEEQDKKTNIEVLVYNSELPQNDLSGNEFTITIEPKEGEDGFSCRKAIDLKRYVLEINEDFDLSQHTILQRPGFDSLLGYYVKVSDETPSYKSLKGGSINFYEMFSGIPRSFEITDEAIVDNNEDILNISEVALIVYNPVEYKGMNITEPGVYLQVLMRELIEKIDYPTISAKLDDNVITATVKKGEFEPVQYCLNKYQENTDGCEWKDFTSKNLTFEINQLGNYYVHVKDELDFIGHSNQVMNYSSTGAAKSLINKDVMWQSGLEGDGLRYTGASDKYCEYDNGEHYVVISKDNNSCPKLYNYVRTDTSDGNTYEGKYSKTCPTNTSYYTYDCSEISGVLKSGEQTNNFICFGTTDKSECTSTTTDKNGLTGIDKYMYRVIGVFPNEEGTMHLKLISYNQLGIYNWHSTNFYYYDELLWENTDLYNNLNSSTFLNNTNYSYLQDTTWLNKIEDWKWAATSSFVDADQNLNYINESLKMSYLHEMNRKSNKVDFGNWTNPVAKIGLMYVNDIALSLNNSKDKINHYGWINPLNNDVSKNSSEWTMTRGGYNNGVYYVSDDKINFLSYESEYSENPTMGVRPVFYLTSDVELNGGTGSITDPYILK